MIAREKEIKLEDAKQIKGEEIKHKGTQQQKEIGNHEKEH